MRRLTLKHERLQTAHDGFASVLSIQSREYIQSVQSERSIKRGVLQPVLIRGVEETVMGGSKD